MVVEFRAKVHGAPRAPGDGIKSAQWTDTVCDELRRRDVAMLPPFYEVRLVFHVDPRSYDKDVDGPGVDALTSAAIALLVPGPKGSPCVGLIEGRDKIAALSAEKRVAASMEEQGVEITVIGGLPWHTRWSKPDA